MKAARERDYPEIRRPKREIWIEPTLEDINEFDNRHIINAQRLAVDIETAGNQVTCIGFAPSERLAIVIPFLRSEKRGRNYWPDIETERAAWKIVRRILERSEPAKTFQNGLYDIAFLWRSMGIQVFGATEDTMLLHHALQPESLKSLGFLGSIYSDEGSWKHMRKTATIKADE
jgi:DNA polymerase I-like protein with 3'-5' exonuclease and polymerase domains